MCLPGPACGAWRKCAGCGSCDRCRRGLGSQRSHQVGHGGRKPCDRRCPGFHRIPERLPVRAFAKARRMCELRIVPRSPAGQGCRGASAAAAPRHGREHPAAGKPCSTGLGRCLWRPMPGCGRLSVLRSVRKQNRCDEAVRGPLRARPPRSRRSSAGRRASTPSRRRPGPDRPARRGRGGRPSSRPPRTCRKKFFLRPVKRFEGKAFSGRVPLFLLFSAH